MVSPNGANAANANVARCRVLVCTRVGACMCVCVCPANAINYARESATIMYAGVPECVAGKHTRLKPLAIVARCRPMVPPNGANAGELIRISNCVYYMFCFVFK